MKKFSGLLLFVVFFALSLQAVAWAEAGPVVGLVENPTLKRGVELYEQGRLDEALSEFRKVTTREDQSPTTLRAYYFMARIFYAQKDPEKALDNLGNIPDGEKTPPMWLLQGAALIGSGLTQQGLSVLGGVDEKVFSPEDRVLFYQAMAEGNIELKRTMPALYFIQAALFLSQGTDTLGFLEKARNVFEKEADSAILNEAGFMFKGVVLGDMVSLEKARRLRLSGNSDEALSYIRTVLKTSKHPFTFQEAEKAHLEMTGEAWLQRTIGVILPLSGRYASFGRLVKRGLEMALQADQEAGKGSVRFIFRDSAADPEKAALAVYELAREGQAMGIIGPIFGPAVLSAARQAQEQRIPLLALSPRQGLPQMGDYIFRNSLTSSAQVDALLQYAIVEQGIRTFGVLYPDSRMGQEFAASFLSQLRRMGGEVVASQSYSDKATDFRVPIKLLLGLDPNAPEPEEEAKNDSEEGILPESEKLAFEALFIPDYAERIGLLAPQLAYYGVEKAQLLGISGWNNPDLTRVAGNYVEGAVFPDGFFAFSPYLFVKDFVDRFQALHQQEPSILDAQGFDAANIVLKLLEDPQVRTREDLRDALGSLKNYPGVTGATSFNAQGEAEKVLYLLQVRNGNIEQIN